MPFRPQLRSRSADRAHLRNGKNFQARMRDFSRNKADRLRKLEEELTRRQCTFKPDMTKSAKSIEQLRRLDRRRKRELERRAGESSTPSKSERKSHSRSRSRAPKSQTRRKKDLLRQLELSGDQSEAKDYRSDTWHRQSREEAPSEPLEEEYHVEQKRRKARPRAPAQKYANQSNQFARAEDMSPGERGFRRADVLFDNLNNTELGDNTLLRKVSGMGKRPKVGSESNWHRRGTRQTSSWSRGICTKRCHIQI